MASFLKTGDRIIMDNVTCGGTDCIAACSLPDMGAEVSSISAPDVDAVKAE